jgi:hypothetical protein
MVWQDNDMLAARAGNAETAARVRVARAERTTRRAMTGLQDRERLLSVGSMRPIRRPWL